jgi:ferrous iron transport protein B
MQNQNITLIGNPNSGKTKLFNLLTGDNQTVGNWAGVTIASKSGEFITKNQTFNITDLPGIYAINNKIPSLDEKVAQDFIKNNPDNLYLNIIDSSNLERAIYLTTELRKQNIKIIILLNMMDISDKKGIKIDSEKLAKKLKCQVIPMSLKQGFDANILLENINNYQELTEFKLDYKIGENEFENSENKFKSAKLFIQDIIIKKPFSLSISDKIDNIATGSFSGILVFFAVIYLLFLFSINFGGAFIDFFDILAGAIFIDGLSNFLTSINTPNLIITIFAGIGSGIQVVATFIPVIGALYLFLTLLEESGYMARAAFVMDRFMRKIGLSGKAFVPLIVGFGCNVPGIMATRTLSGKQERLSTIMMSPFMSCGARLAVYALFAAAFFPTGGANIVFTLYLIGIIMAIATGFILKKGFNNNENNFLIMEMPNYQTPHLKSVLSNTWNKLKSFVLSAGKIIVVVVALISIVDNIGTDGSFNNQNSEKSVLSASAKTITPAFAPMGIKDDNWEAVVGIITGILAKEVVVGTLDSLYNKGENTEDEFDFMGQINEAFVSVKNNLIDLSNSLTDPLGFSIIDSSKSPELAAIEQEISTNTLSTMQVKFDGKVGAFAYLLFILLYFPCVAALGAMMREAGTKWGIIGALWSTTLAYSMATIFYQVVNFSINPIYSITWISICIIAIIIFIKILKNTAKNTNNKSIDIINR